MHCLKCGELAPEGSKYCPKCGALLENNIDEQDLAVVCASQKVTNDTPNDLRGEAKTKKRVQLSKTAKIVIVIIVNSHHWTIGFYGGFGEESCENMVSVE